MLGREIYGTDCIFTEHDEKAESSGDSSLAQAYPDGWSFPAMLPPAHKHDTLSAALLAEARKFSLRFNLANQNLGPAQLAGSRGRHDLLESVLGNVGNMMAFRLDMGVPDSERLRPFLKPFTPEQMQHLPNYHALVRLLDREGPVGPIIQKILNA